MPTATMPGVVAAEPFPVKLMSPITRWRVSHERLALFNHSVGVCDWVVSLDIDTIVSRPFPELFFPLKSGMYVTYAMDPRTYPYGVNGGVFAFSPTPELYRQVLWRAKSCTSCTDQTIIGNLDANQIVLSHVYNMSPAACDSSAFKEQQARFVKLWHFTFMPKQWNLDVLPECVVPVKGFHFPLL